MSSLNVFDEAPMGWCRPTPALQAAEARGDCQVKGPGGRRDGRVFVVATTEAGRAAWSEFAKESAERMRRFPILDPTHEELLAAVFATSPEYRRPNTGDHPDHPPVDGGYRGAR